MGQVQMGPQRASPLAQPNAQMNQQQQQAAAFRANLDQALFETERMATRVAETMRHDVFAAAIHSHYWLQTIVGITAPLFADTQSKRAWADATQILRSAQQRGQSDPSRSRTTGQYLRAMGELERLRPVVGDHPGDFVAHARADVGFAAAEFGG